MHGERVHTGSIPGGWKKQILLLLSVALKAANSTQNTYAYTLCILPVHGRKKKKHCRYEQGGLTRHALSLAWLEANWYFSEEGLARLVTSGFKKGCVLLYYSSTEFESTVLFLFIVYWSNVGAAWLSSTGLSIWSYLFWGGSGWGE